MTDTTDNGRKLPRLNWRMLPWLKGSTDSPPSTPAGFRVEPPVQESVEPPASSPAEAADEFPPLKVVIVGDTAQVDRSPLEKDEWTSEDFARLFILWLTHEVPETRGKWVSALDIETEYFERFQVAAECYYLEVGSLLRGLGRHLGKAGKRDRTYTDATGKRREKAEYKIPKVAANVIDLAERKRA
jgi:hypothetical protein